MNAMFENSPPDDVRQQLHALAERLPENATWMDVEEYARFRAAVAEGKTAIDNDEIAGEDEIRRVFARFGVAV